MMMAPLTSLSIRCFVIGYSGGYQRGNATPADGGCPPSISVPDDPLRQRRKTNKENLHVRNKSERKR